MCVCDATHCDLPGPSPDPTPDRYTLVTSNRAGQRFHTTTPLLVDSPEPGNLEGKKCTVKHVNYIGYMFNVWSNVTYFSPSTNPFTSSGGLLLEVATASPQQTMEGFGSAFTDAATINTHALSPQTQDHLIRSVGLLSSALSSFLISSFRSFCLYLDCYPSYLPPSHLSVVVVVVVEVVSRSGSF